MKEPRFVDYLKPASAAKPRAHGIKYATEPLRTSGFCISVGPVYASNVSLSFIRKFRSTLESAHIVNVLISQLRRIYRQLQGISLTFDYKRRNYNLLYYLICQQRSGLEMGSVFLCSFSSVLI